MFLKIMAMVDEHSNTKDLESFLDALNDKVDISTDITVLDGMVADSLEAASPYENVHSKLLIDATTLAAADPRSTHQPLEGSFSEEAPAWRQGSEQPPSFSNIEAVRALPEVVQARMLRGSMLVVTTNVVGTPSPELGSSDSDDEAEGKRRDKVAQLKESIWQLENSNNLRWLFITNSDVDLDGPKARRRLLWQLTSRFDVGRGLSFDATRQRLCWDATTPIPSSAFGVRRWPAITLHSPETLEKVAQHPELESYEWPPHLSFGGPE